MSKDAVKPNLPASNEVAFDHAWVPTQSDPSTAELGKLIAEALADFDPEFPSERRLKVHPARPPVTFPSTWAKKAG